MLLALGMAIVVGQKVWTIIFTLVPFMVLSRQLNFISLIENIRRRNTINIIDQFFYTCVILLIFFYHPQNYEVLILALYIKEITAIILVIAFYHLRIHITKADIKLLGETIAFGIYPMLTMLLTTLNYQVDVIILKAYVDFEQIGYYTIGVGLANQAWVIPDAFKDVLFAKTAKSDSMRDIRLSLIINIVFSTVLFVVVSLIGKQIITILYGVEFISAYKVTTVIFAGSISMVLFKLLMPLYNAKGKQKISFYILLTSCIINIVMNIILIPLYGITGAALASVISYTICGAAFLLGLRFIM
jgi:O-antigen/teichoic acid export membrane protein